MAIKIENQKIAVSGELTSNTVQALHDSLNALLISRDDTFAGSIDVDFADVTKVDTASLAFCLGLERRLLNKVGIKYCNVPDEMLTIAGSVGIGSLFEK